MKYKKYKLICLLLVFFCFINGLLFDNAHARQKYLFKMGTVSPDGIALAVFIKKKFTDTIKEVTNKEVGFSWYWGSIMGDEEDFLAKTRINQLQGAMLSVGGCLMVCPPISVLELPFMFNNFDEVAYIRKKMKPRFNELVKQNGYKMLLLVDQDFDQIYSTKYEFRTIDDFKKSKFLTHAGSMEYKLLKVLGAKPMPIGVPEVASSVRAGVCDAVISPALWWLGTQLYTVTKFVNTTQFRYSPLILVVSTKAWDNLPEKHKIAIDRELPALEEILCETMHDGNEKGLRGMINYGVKEVVLTPKELDAFKKKTESMWDDLIGDEYQRAA